MEYKHTKILTPPVSKPEYHYLKKSAIQLLGAKYEIMPTIDLRNEGDFYSFYRI
jgi:hypothetical protein